MLLALFARGIRTMLLLTNVNLLTDKNWSFKRAQRRSLRASSLGTSCSRWSGLSSAKQYQDHALQSRGCSAPLLLLQEYNNDRLEAVLFSNPISVCSASYQSLMDQEGFHTNSRCVAFIFIFIFITKPEEENEILELSRTPDLHKKLVESIAPAIFGHNGIYRAIWSPPLHTSSDIKRALLCQLFGGSAKVLPDKTRLRGDINILLLGDPGTAKSQLLKFIEKVAFLLFTFELLDRSLQLACILLEKEAALLV